MPANCLVPIIKCAYKQAQQQIKEAFQDGDFLQKVHQYLSSPDVLENMLKPGAAKTFHDYGQIFIRYITCQLQHATRLDIVWDLYLPESLKATAGTKRGKGIRRRVDPSNRLPGNWGAFLRNDHNKEELFRYLAQLSVTVNLWGQRGFVNHGRPGVVQHTQKS